MKCRHLQIWDLLHEHTLIINNWIILLDRCISHHILDLSYCVIQILMLITVVAVPLPHWLIIYKVLFTLSTNTPTHQMFYGPCNQCRSDKLLFYYLGPRIINAVVRDIQRYDRVGSNNSRTDFESDKDNVAQIINQSMENIIKILKEQLELNKIP